MTFHWTDEATAQLRKLFHEGHSFSIIASLISKTQRQGLISRNACIGKASRLGLQRGALEQRIATRAHDLKAAGARLAPLCAKAPPRRKVPPHPFEPKRKPLAEQVAEIVFLAPAGGLTFLEQRDGYCRFPITVETDFDSFRVCGCLCKMTQPYCDEHTAKAHQPTRPKPQLNPAPRKRDTSEMFFKDWV